MNYKAMTWLFMAGCAGPTLVGHAVDQNPLLKPDHTSEGIAIQTKDAQIIANSGAAVEPASRPGGPPSGYASTGAGYFHPAFHQSAIFQANSASDLVFLLELSNRWPELTHAENYDCILSDDKGRQFRAAEVHSTAAHVVFQTMALGRTDVVHMVAKTVTGNIYVSSHNEESTTDVSKNMMAARSLLEFRGDQILTPQTRKLKLSLRNKNRDIEFIWEFKAPGS
jgi:hypothetical protein